MENSAIDVKDLTTNVEGKVLPAYPVTDKGYTLSKDILEDFFNTSKSGKSLIRVPTDGHMIIVPMNIANKIKKGIYTDVVATFAGELPPNAEAMADGRNRIMNTYRVDSDSLTVNSTATVIKAKLAEAEEIVAALGADGLEKLQAASAAFKAVEEMEMI